MLKRRVQDKSLTEKYEEITSSKNWIVPSGCTSVDAFVVAGGKDGGSSGPYNGGLGGNGGEVVYELNIPVTPGQSIPVTVGKANENSSFLSLSATSGYGARGGYVPQSDGLSPSNGGDGYDGTYLFGTYTSKYPNRYGAGGGAGCYIRGWNEGYFYGGSGGSYGGGKGASDDDSEGIRNGKRGGNATFYGAGGGGASKSSGIGSVGASGGNGYQGIVILHYWSY